MRVFLTMTLMALVSQIVAADEQTINVVLDPRIRAVLSSEVNSPVLRIHKRMGDDFQEGDLLIELDSAVFEGSMLKAQSLFEKFDLELKAKERLFKDQALSLFEVKEAQAQLKNAEAEYITAKKYYNATAIRGPFNGKVVKLGVEDREFAQAGKELIEVIDDSSLYARFLVPATMLSCLKLGDHFLVNIRDTDIRVNAILNRISPVIDPASSTVKVEAEIKNDDGRLKAGMIGTITVNDCHEPSYKKELYDNRSPSRPTE